MSIYSTAPATHLADLQHNRLGMDDKVEYRDPALPYIPAILSNSELLKKTNVHTSWLRSTTSLKTLAISTVL